MKALATVVALLVAGPACADEMTWTMRSGYQYRVQLEFYSQTRSHEWPGGGQAWGLNDYETHDFTLRCNSGEKICYGAWVTGNSDRYWGVGADNGHGCTRCCATCGSSNPDINLTP